MARANSTSHWLASSGRGREAPTPLFPCPYRKFGNRPITGEEGQWGLEHLKLDEARLKEIGADGLVQPLELSIKDHEGGGAGKILQWDGDKWKIVSNGWVKSDRDLLLPLIYERAAAYAKEKGITPRSDTNASN